MDNKIIWDVIVILGGIIMLAQAINAYNFQYYINQSTVPTSFLDYIFISTDKNATLVFTHHNYTTSVNNITLENDSNTYNLTFNVSLPYMSIGNYTTNFTIKKINIVNITYTNISLFFAILNDTLLNATIVEIGFNKYFASICDTSLPFTSAFISTISLETDINPVCDDFLICPAIIYPDEKEVIINISVPINLAIGTYTKIANFGSNIGNITFIFEIKDCYFDIGEYCTNVSDIEDLIKCQAALIENLKKINKTKVLNDTIVVERNITQERIEKVMVIGNETFDLLSSLRTVATGFKTAQSDLQSERKRNDELVKEYADKLEGIEKKILQQQSESDIRARQIVSDIISENRNLSALKLEIEDKSWSKISVIIFIFTIVIIISGILGYKYIQKEFTY